MPLSNRIVASVQHIDKSLAETKGRPFVERMRETLPSLTTPGKYVEERNMAAEDDDVVIKIC